jgi:hypothetical protein
MTRRRFLGGLAAIAGAVATGGVATYFATRGSEANTVDNNVSPSITGGNPNPTEIPTVPGTATSTNTPEATQTLTAINVEAPVIAGEINKPEIRRILDKYYIPVGYPVHTYGNVSLAVSKKIQEREEGCGETRNGETACRINERFITSEIPEAESRLKQFYSTGLLIAWSNMRDNKPASQIGIAVDIANETPEAIFAKAEQFQKRVDSGEDFSFTVQGYQGKPELFTKAIAVNPAKPIIDVSLPDNTGTFFNIVSGFDHSFTIIDGALVIGSYEGTSEGLAYLKFLQGDKAKLAESKLKSNPSDNLMYAITTLGDRQAMDLLAGIRTNKQGRVNYSLADFERLGKIIDILTKILRPNYRQGPQETWGGGIIRVQ